MTRSAKDGIEPEQKYSHTVHFEVLYVIHIVLEDVLIFFFSLPLINQQYDTLLIINLTLMDPF